MEHSLKKSRIEILLLFVLYLFILPRVYMDYDMGFWRQWALTIHHNGLAHAYGSTINYFPIYIYGLYIYDLLQGTDASIAAHINEIKILFVFFDFLPLFVLCCFRQRILNLKIPYLFLMLNVAYIFNSMVWGQIDSIYTNLSFLAIITGLLYPTGGSLLYLLALNTKPQAIEFAPVMAIVLMYSVRNMRTAATILVSCLLAEAAILLPFMSTGGPSKLFHIAGNVVGLYPKLSICAFNIWYLIQPGNPYFINDADHFILLSYRTWGLLLFAGAALWVCVPLGRRAWKLRQSSQAFDHTSLELLFLSTGLVCLYFFYFNAQMHERYAHPIIIFLFFHAVVSRNYKLYILASIPYILSLDKCFTDYLPIIHYKAIFASKVIALWYTATVAYGSFIFYQLQKRIKAENVALT